MLPQSSSLSTGSGIRMIAKLDRSGGELIFANAGYTQVAQDLGRDVSREPRVLRVHSPVSPTCHYHALLRISFSQPATFVSMSEFSLSLSGEGEGEGAGIVTHKLCRLLGRGQVGRREDSDSGPRRNITLCYYLDTALNTGHGHDCQTKDRTHPQDDFGQSVTWSVPRAHDQCQTGQRNLHLTNSVACWACLQARHDRADFDVRW